MIAKTDDPLAAGGVQPCQGPARGRSPGSVAIGGSKVCTFRSRMTWHWSNLIANSARLESAVASDLPRSSRVEAPEILKTCGPWPEPV